MTQPNNVLYGVQRGSWNSFTGGYIWGWCSTGITRPEAVEFAMDLVDKDPSKRIAIFRTATDEEIASGKREVEEYSPNKLFPELDVIKYVYEEMFHDGSHQSLSRLKGRRKDSEYIALMEDDYLNTLQYGVQFRSWSAEGKGQWVWVRENVTFESAVEDLEKVISKVGSNSARLLKTSGSNPWAPPREDEIVIIEEATEQDLFNQAEAEPGDLFLVKPEERRYTEVLFKAEIHIKIEGV